MILLLNGLFLIILLKLRIDLLFNNLQILFVYFLLLIYYSFHFIIGYSSTLKLLFVNELARLTRYTTFKTMKILAWITFRSFILKFSWILSTILIKISRFWIVCLIWIRLLISLSLILLYTSLSLSLLSKISYHILSFTLTFLKNNFKCE